MKPTIVILAGILDIQISATIPTLQKFQVKENGEDSKPLSLLFIVGRRTGIRISIHSENGKES